MDMKLFNSIALLWTKVMSMARRKTSVVNINRKLSDDVVKLIFSKLPFSNLPNCRIICKAWNHLVLDYAKFHHPNAFFVCAYKFDTRDWRIRRYNKMQCIDFDTPTTTTTTTSVATLRQHSHWTSVSIRSFCNGLVQIHRRGGNFGCDAIWNPMTDEYFELPKIKKTREYGHDYGFGFSPKTNQYKLFRVYRDVGPVSTLEVLRFGIDNELGWRTVGDQPFGLYGRGTYLDGVIYWLGNDITDEYVLYGIDVETETFETIHIDVGPYPPEAHFRLFPFNGTICVIIEMFEPNWERQVWVMRAKYFWIREFVVDASEDESDDDQLYFIKALENEGRISFLLGNHLFHSDKKGQKTHPLSYSDMTEVSAVVRMGSFHFGSLSKILAGNHL